MFRFSDRENYAGLQLLKLICFDFQGGKFKLYLIPGSSVFTFDLRKLAHQISNVRGTTDFSMIPSRTFIASSNSTDEQHMIGLEREKVRNRIQYAHKTTNCQRIISIHPDGND